MCEPCTQQQNCLEHSLECSTASGYESTLECTLASEGYWLNQGIATVVNLRVVTDNITTPCDGTRASDDLGCTECQSTCSDGQYITSNRCLAMAQEQVMTCPDGYIVNSDSTACTPIICEENQYVLSSVCEPYADGSYNATGDDAVIASNVDR